MGFNSSKAPFSDEMIKINKESGYPEWALKYKKGKWVKNKFTFYKCID